MHDRGVVGAEVDGLLFETEGADEPVDGGERIAVAEAGDDGGAAGFGLVAHRVGHSVGHGVKGATGVRVVSWKNRRGVPPYCPRVNLFDSSVYDVSLAVKYS